MAFTAARAALIGATANLAVALCGCVPVYTGPAQAPVARVDPEDVADRVMVGSVAGAALGTGLGSVFAINPGIGAVIGVETGATLGAAAGALTAQPLPTYRPVVVPTASVVPGFYDSWPPGSHSPPAAAGAPPPPG